MKHISFMMGKKVLAAVLLLLSGGTGAFAQEWIDVTEGYIKNADYSEGNTGWTLSGGSKTVTDATNRNAEIYENTGSSTQQISGLPSGTYKLTVRGYYRDGDFASAENAHQNKTEDIQAFLFAGDNQKVFVSVFSAAPHESEIKTNNNSWYKGYPNSRTTMRQFCDAYPTAYVNELEFTVSEDNSSVSVGVRVDKSGSRIWTCWSEFKLYLESSAAYDAFSSMLTKITDISGQLRGVGAIAAAEELDGLYETYKGYTEETSGEDLQAAISVLSNNISATSGTVEYCEALNASFPEAESLLADCRENGKYSEYAQCTQDISQLETLIATAKSQLPTIAVADLQTKIPELTESVNAEIDALHARISFNYSLLNVKGLADKIGGLTENEAYKKVEADLSTIDLTYETMKADVAALNLACMAVMTPDFLAEATIDNPIDLTSFIVNPNICQGNDATKMPDGWSQNTSKRWDGSNRTSIPNTDTDLYCYSWTGDGNKKISIGNGWYYQLIGATDGGVKLPNGRYILKAATYSTRDDNAAYLYASKDNTANNAVKALINREESTYLTASEEFATTTATDVIEVRIGELYIGMMGRCHNGEDDVTGNGNHWSADNFRLYYVGALPSIEEFKKEVAEMETAGSVLTEIGAIRAASDLTALVDTYNAYTDETSAETVDGAKENVAAKMKLFQETLPKLNTSLQNGLTAGQDLLNRCTAGDFFASEANQAVLSAAMSNSVVVVSASELDVLEAEMEAQIAAVNKAVDDLRTRISFNDILLKAKALADEITGLSEEEAYTNVIAALDAETLTYDEMKAQVAALNAVCAAEMTPGFLAAATEEDPIELTSFIANPNIYQGGESKNAPDGWNCDTRGSVNNENPTTDSFMDSDLWCYSWSGNESNSVGSAWYYQQIGGADGSVNLPDGWYILKAATYSTGGDNAAYLYVGDENTAESVGLSKINTDENTYQTACANLSTTTSTQKVVVKGGQLYIGMMGRYYVENEYVWGNGKQWNADNFRLYYVGALETTVNLTMKVDWATLMLPFDAELQEGMTAYSCASVAEDGMLNLVKVEDGLKANVPYIINAATGSEFGFTGIGSAENTAYKVGLLTGVYQETLAPVGSYVLQNNKTDGLAFYHVAENKQPKVGANRAYLTLPETLGANVRVVYFPTDVDGVTDVEAADVMVDVYTLDGICVRSQVKKSEALKGLKGIYILKNVK